MKLFSLSVSALALVATLGAAGCAADNGTTEDIDDTTGALEVPNPSGAYFASVNALGTGCPAGTWDASISSDGQAFTVLFSGYETSLAPGQSTAVKDCTLMIDFRSPSGLSFAVSDFYYQGYVALDQPGMTARQTARYYFQGMPVGSKENRSDLWGPRNDSYLFQDTIGTVDLVWSPCGASRRLIAQTRIVLNNNPQKSGSGYIDNSSIDASTRTLYRFNLSWRRC